MGPLLFLIYVADLPQVISHPSKIRMFADDTKIFREISGKDDELELQKDLDNIFHWCKTWLLELNFQKYKIIRFGKGSVKPKYAIRDGSQHHALEAVSQEKDLGIIFDQNINFRSHIELKIKIASRNLALIRNSFKYADKTTFLLLYKSLVRPHLEFCSPVWNSSVKYISNKIENVQERATKLVRELKFFPYEFRNQSLGLPSLEFRRHREDIITAFKICKFSPDIMNNMFQFQLKPGLRGHAFALHKEQSLCKSFKNHLSNRIFKTWNSFPPEFSNLPNLNGLKGFIDNYFGDTRYHRHLALSGTNSDCLRDGGSETVAGCLKRASAYEQAMHLK